MGFSFAELSSAQRRIWFLNQFAPGNIFYNEPLLALRIQGKLDEQALQCAVDGLVERQEALRTTFPAIDGNPVQRVAPPQPCPIEFIDLSRPSRFASLRRAVKFARTQAHLSFDVQNGPLVVVSLARLADNDHLFTMTMHHIITDGWSLRVLLSELIALYRYHAGISVAIDGPPAVGYLDYSRWERTFLNEQRLEALLTYWRTRLADASPYFDFLTDIKRPDVPSFRGGTIKRILPADHANKLRQLARDHSVSLYVVLLTVFKCLIARCSGRFDVLVGTPVANRHLPDAEKLVGLFVNVVVVRTSLAGNPPFPVVLQKVADGVVEALDHQMLPFDLLVNELCPRRDPHRQAYTQLFFAHHNFPHRTLDVEQLRIDRWDIPQDECKFDLVLFTNERSDGAVDVRMTYSRDLYLRSTACRLIEAYMAGLSRLENKDQIRLSALFKPREVLL